MTVSHHLDDTTLLAYAAGTLDDAFSLLVACHLAMCPQCRSAASRGEEAGGELLAGLPVATGAESGNFKKILKRIDAKHDKPSRGARDDDDVTIAHSDVPYPLRRHAGLALSDIDWKTVAPGIRRFGISLDDDSASQAYMLKIASGRSLPEHGHHGHEMTLVLSGAYRDTFGRFGRGDVADLDEHVEHRPVVEQGEPCICLVATQAPARFKNPLSRMLQPIIRI